jgi:hypothetical protein
LIAQPAFHFLEAKIGRRMDDAEGSGNRAGGVRHFRQTLTFAYHTVFQMPHVEDAIPVGAPTPFQF